MKKITELELTDSFNEEDSILGVFGEKVKLIPKNKLEKVVEGLAFVGRNTSGKQTSIYDTSAGNMLLEGLVAGSHQNQLSGKNLYDINKLGASYNINSSYITSLGTPLIVTYTAKGGYMALSFAANVQNLKGKTITFSAISNYAGGLNIGYYNGSARTSLTTRPMGVLGKIVVTATYPEDIDDSYIPIIWFYGDDANNLTVTFTDIQIEVGSVATDYEPYCGGTSSPNPEYQQTIRSVGDMGWFDGKLVNMGYTTAGVWNAVNTNVSSLNPIPCKGGDEIKFIYKGDLVASQFLRVSYLDENETWLSNTYGKDGENSVTVIAPNNAKYFVIGLSMGYDIKPSDYSNRFCVTINGKYAVIIDEVGKNLYDGEANAAETTANGTTVKKISDGGVNFSGTSTNTVNIIQRSFSLPAGTYTYSFETIYNGSYNYNVGVCLYNITDAVFVSNTISGVSFTIDTEKTFDIRLQLASGRNADVDIFIQIESGDKSTSYTPYTHKRTYIPIPAPLRGYDGAKDEICYRDGQYGVMRRLGGVTFDGGDGVEWKKSTTPSVFFTAIREAKKVTYPKSLYTYCDQYICNRSAAGNMPDKTFKVAKSSDTTNAQFYIKDQNYTTIDEFKARLQASPVTVEYELDEPVFEPFEDQTPFYNLQSFDEVTNVSIKGLSEGVEPSMSVLYPKNLEGSLITMGYASGKRAEAKVDQLLAAQVSATQEE